jgi:hypothetical protein
MTTFDKRKDAFENKFAHDAELEFKITVRRNKMLGEWAARLMGLEGADADAYAKSVVQADFIEVGDEDVIGKVVTDFAVAGVAVNDAAVRSMLGEKAEAARQQILSAT